VFNGSPASVNLRVPPYSFKSDRALVIGVDPGSDKAEKGAA
jgi:Rieske Fe-S protein